MVASLLDLPRLAQGDRRMLFRQVMAELARASTEEGPGPLEGCRPDALVTSVGAAIEGRLLDDLDWLDPGAAGSALYLLAAALPPGPEKHDLGRRVLGRLLEGNATTFALMATQMARAGGKGLMSTPVVARVSLLVELPIACGILDGPLALAITSRRHLSREYVVAKSTRSLSERRLAARLLERAASEAARRAAEGDRSGLRLVGPDGLLESVWRTLLADREPLVWRHLAVARGLLLPFSEAGAITLEQDFSPKLTPTEWRRAAAALGGVAAHRPDLALDLASRAFRGGLLDRDPGAVAPYLWGLTRAAEAEPEAADELFDLAVKGPAEDFADAVVYLRRELGSSPLVEKAEKRALERLATKRSTPSSDDGAVALAAALVRDLERSSDDTDSLSSQAENALLAFATEGAKPAHAQGLALLEAARGGVDTLLAVGDEEGDSATSGMARRAAFAVVRDIDFGLLERSVVDDLLRLDSRADRVSANERSLEKLRERVFTFILDRELGSQGDGGASAEAQRPPSPARPQAHLTLHFTRLRALLHLLDSDATDDDSGASPAWTRWRIAARRLSQTLAASPMVGLRRAFMATLARSLDALARSGACDISDVLLVSAEELDSARDLDTLAEASMDPDTTRLMQRMSALVKAERGEAEAPAPIRSKDSLFPPAETPAADAVDLTLDAMERLGDALAEAGTSRSDSLRAVLVKLHHALVTTCKAQSLRDLAPSEGEVEVALALENATAALRQILSGARSRALDETPNDDLRGMTPRALSTLLAQTLGGATDALVSDEGEAVQTMVTGIPRPFARIVTQVLGRLTSLPIEGSGPDSRRAEAAPQDQLPAWVPKRRALGAFYLERPLGAGGVGSVFVVTRIEDRHELSAERFALKVPDYNANAARHLSEAEFLALFRSEASALMSLPPHDSLARFVTFDLAARPKPILVMELVEGPNLERLIDNHALTTGRALTALVEVLDGLTAMHDAGVGHLDLKPANIVLRPGGRAVLVDFGLAGKNIRLGCGSAPYSAPEVWGVAPDGTTPTPMAADVYGFACMAFEALTGTLLFEAETEIQMVSQHLAHDGLPPKLRAFASDPRFRGLAELLFAALRHDPLKRVSARDLREELALRVNDLAEVPWPLPAHPE